ncbi:MAG: pyridoxal-phosphate dependent enzyme [Candidatus Eisenbacteria bacterium]|nr:pyridoxal-phosphate dependent enzyme [Candidatus Eisenbacteria bacterium]
MSAEDSPRHSIEHAAPWPLAPPRLRLAHLPTPIEPLPPLSGWPAGPRVDLKRDDLTGVALSGNKIRKLEFVLADAREQGADCLVTCGGAQSNHARATSVSAARLGLGCQLLLAGTPETPPRGNLLLDRLLGAEVRWLTPAQYEQRDLELQRAAERLEAAGQRPYVIPEGASNEVGAWGYIAMLAELVAQHPSRPWTHIVCATGSGGTHAGLLIGSRLLQWDVRVRSYLVQRTRDYFVDQVLRITEAFAARYEVPLEFAREEIDIVAGFEGPAYAEPYDEEIALIRAAAREGGLLFDPVYTGKALTGLRAEIAARRFAPDDRILFVHTGGIFGLLAQGERFLTRA